MPDSLRILSAVNSSVTADNGGLTSTQSDYVIILAALFCALICSIGLILAARCVCLHHPLNLFTTGSALQTSAPSPPGLSKKTLQLLPTRKYIFEAGGSNKQTDCAICLTDFGDGDMMRILPRCSHAFHVTCIDTWLGSHSSCPSCRQLVLVVGQCCHCGGFSTHRGFHGTPSEVRVREIDMMCRQDNLTPTIDNLLELSAFEEPSSTHQGIFHGLSPLLPEDDLLDFSQIATEEPSSRCCSGGPDCFDI